MKTDVGLVLGSHMLWIAARMQITTAQTVAVSLERINRSL